MTDPSSQPNSRLDSIPIETPLDWNRLRDVPQSNPILPYFITGSENRLTAFVNQSIEHVFPNGNPILLTGPSGSGKTAMVIHLAKRLQEIALNGKSFKRATSSADQDVQDSVDVLYMSSDDFHREYTETVAADVLQTLREKIQNASIWILEDLQHLQNKRTSQEELALRIEARTLTEKPTLLTCIKRPSEFSGMRDDFSSRCLTGITLPLTLPGYDARKQILMELSIHHEVNLNDELISMLLLNIEADVSVRKLDSLIRSISLWCRMHQSSPTCEAIKLAVESGAKTKNISLSKITSAVAKHFKIRSSEIRSGSRKQKLVRARSLAMLLARQLTTKTMLQIGNFYGGRDHTTVLHALRSTEEKLAKDSQLAHALDSIKDQLSR